MVLGRLGNFAKQIAPTALATIQGGPVAGFATFAGQQAAERQQKEMNMAFERGFGDPVSVAPQTMVPQDRGFFGNLGSGIASFGSELGGFLQDVTPTLNMFGVRTPLQRTNSGTATTIQRQGAEETASSGEFMGANLGAGLSLLSQGARALRSPGGQMLVGGGLGLAGGMMSSGGNGAPRVTRKMKSDVRRVYMMAGMDPAMTASILNEMGTYPRMNFDASTVFFILTKRFRNDGPVVTKAAVRKTRTTLRRMKSVSDMYNSVCKPTTRRAPARRSTKSAVQLIKN